MKWILILLTRKRTRRPRSGAQSGSRIYQFGGGGVRGNQFPTFDAEFKFAKIQNSHVLGGGVRGNQFPTFDAEFKFAKIQNPMLRVGGGGVGAHGILMLSSNLLKSKIPMLREGGLVEI